jgi:hypothetical protein
LAFVSFVSLVDASDLAGSAFVSVLEVDEESEDDDDVLLECDAEPLRLSVAYQPEPLKITPAGYSTRRTLAPHSGQSLIGSS